MGDYKKLNMSLYLGIIILISIGDLKARIYIDSLWKRIFKINDPFGNIY